jgi:hypothetical protein
MKPRHCAPPFLPNPGIKVRHVTGGKAMRNDHGA